MRLPKKLWKCSQRGLKEDNTLGGVPFYESKLLVSYIRTCHDPIGHIRHTSNSQPLQPMATFYLWNERLIFTSDCVQSILLYLPYYGNISLPSPFVFHALVDIVSRFFDTDLSELIRLSVVEF